MSYFQGFLYEKMLLQFCSSLNYKSEKALFMFLFSSKYQHFFFINFVQVEFGCVASLSAGDELPLRQGSGSQPDAPQHSGIAAGPR
jgi:hypothetical protein